MAHGAWRMAHGAWRMWGAGECNDSGVRKLKDTMFTNECFGANAQ
jgi:hypothetical protein